MTKRGVSALNGKDAGKFLWRPDFRPHLNEWVADFALAGQAALDRPDWASRMVMFRLYYLALAPYENARHFLGLSEHNRTSDDLGPHPVSSFSRQWAWRGRWWHRSDERGSPVSRGVAARHAFSKLFFPGLILCVVLGGSHLAAAFALSRNRSVVRIASILAGLVLTGWMIGELWLIGFRAPIQAWFLGLGLIEVGLSFTKLHRS